MNALSPFGFPQSPLKRKRQSAFTLVEFLVVASIVAAVLGLGGAAMSAVKKSSEMTREISAGRTLITAYLAYAAENNNRVMIAFDERPGGVWFEPDQRQVGTGSGQFGRTAFRYPFRLAPYFGYKIDGVILGTENGRLAAKAATSSNREEWYYTVSALPSFGINESFMGGKVSSLPARARPGEFGDYGYTNLSKNEAVTNLMSSARIIAFASAAAGIGAGEVQVGNYKVESPATGTWMNKSWNPESNPSEFGSVSARFDGKALCVFLDGSVEAMTIEQLQDMRLWSRNAADQDDPDYMP